MAKIFPISDSQAVQKAADVIRRGGLVAFPTETVYGLGADAFNLQAVARVFEAKQRPSFDPLIVHLPSMEGLPGVARLQDPRVLKLAARFWPGPLTLVLPKLSKVPDLVTAGLDTVGVRIPKHKAALEFLKACGTPVAAPSANLYGRVSPTTARHVAEQLGDKADIILDGGPCAVGLESTIVSLAKGPARLLRPGAVTLEDLQQILGEVDESDRKSVV
jgi:L-threonylcarbamoyladenylate synthase